MPRRPIATRMTSASSVSAAPPAVASIVAVTPEPAFSTFVTLWPSLNAKPCFSSMRWNCLATSPSLVGRIRSRNSTTVTSAPSRRQTEPSSSPITPAPTTMSFFGTLGRLSAPVEETTVFSSISTPGSLATSEPVAITIALVSCVVSAPSALLTTTLPGAAMRPSPLIQSILFFLNRKATPLTLAATVSSLCFIITGRSSFGGATTTPSGPSPCAASSNISDA